MNVLWERQRATVSDIVAALAPRHIVAYNSVQTILRILETKGYVTHDKSGRAFIYRPVVGPGPARRRAIRNLVARLFDNSPSLLVLNVLQDEQVDPAELKRLKQLIEDADSGPGSRS